MIHIKRTEIKLPAILAKRISAAIMNAAEFFSRPAKIRGQQRFKFDPELWREMRPYLLKLFKGKCAFCESPISFTKSGDTEHFRPRVEAMGLDGRSDPDWYWWLAYEWENLYLVCSICDKNKGNQFPVLGARARKGAKGRSLAREKALLIDPCAEHPELFLDFHDDGMVHSTSYQSPVERRRFEGYDRGGITIQILGLNRSNLVSIRQKIAQETIKMFEMLLTEAAISIKFDLTKLLDKFQPYAATRRQVFARQIRANINNINVNPRVEKFFAKALSLLQEEIHAIEVRDKTPSKGKRIKHVEAVYEAAYIQRIILKNFRAIKDLELQFTEVTPSGVGWKMLLGENGAGKSSVLKAVAFALMGEDFIKAVEKLGITSERIFRRKTTKGSGLIRVELSKGEPIEVTFTRKRLVFTSGKKGAANVFLRGYGATRLLAKSRSDVVKSRARSSRDVMNLFDPDSRLGDADRWLSGLDAEAFDSAGLTLKDLLHLDARRPLQKRRGGVYLDAGHGLLPLEEQSDGYQSVLALATDIMAGIPGSIHDKQQASGIVLLDEIDAHLHPRWKMWIVSRLRNSFPNIQFLATTHEPLCLRGLGEREIAVMQRQRDVVTVRDDIPSPSELRVDQLLTSQLFGLDSTIDPDIDAKFQTYYDLLSRHNLSKPQQKLLGELKHELERYNKLGFTRRDQLAYEVIDEFLAKEMKEPKAQKRLEMREETKRKVAEIWGYVTTPRES